MISLLSNVFIVTTSQKDSSSINCFYLLVLCINEYLINNLSDDLIAISLLLYCICNVFILYIENCIISVRVRLFIGGEGVTNVYIINKMAIFMYLYYYFIFCILNNFYSYLVIYMYFFVYIVTLYIENIFIFL